VREILVRDGDVVQQGQVLVRMDATLAGADATQLAHDVALRDLTVRAIDAALTGSTLGLNLKTAVDGRETHQVAVATEQFERRSITGLELLRSRENCPESRANTRSALFGSNDNCGF
jgi:multidrug resistance efflux pump